MGSYRGPTRSQLHAWAETLRAAADLAENGRLVELLERDAVLPVPDGFGPGTLGGGGSGKSDPTQGAALARLEEGSADYVHRCASGALRALDRAVSSAGSAVQLVGEGFRVEEMVRHRELDSDGNPKAPTCVERSCEEPAHLSELGRPDRAGRCEPCYRWRKRWVEKHPGELAPPVPADVIDLRKRNRERAA